MNATLKLSEESIRRCGHHPITNAWSDAPIDTSDIENELDCRGHLEKKNLAIFAIKHSIRRSLPYGIWYCANGREVLFNREYQPIAQRIDGVVSYADRDEWVEGIERAVMLYDDLHNPAGYLVKHLGYMPLSASESNGSKKALLRCLKVLKEFTPAEHASVGSQWSLL